ncbi:MAG: 2,3-bisphosphoglycerate-independent phosphoglycerate mutase [Holosporales bacterium]|jgi:2,3-bisphosphoglycerate-independent phosphoglycerate mutase|nr:2,3-bisphosphoglycerate-independent phosphoglycerate mutase [Holosporales bacterium]
MKKVLLCILDGFGYSESDFGNATLEARYIIKLLKSGRTALLDASGESVGLPSLQVGNSEVGHLTIGAGRVVMQKLPLINNAIASGQLAKNSTLREFLDAAKNHTCHVMGLFSDGGVHSELTHFFWAIDTLRRMNIKTKAHLFLDGRDVGYRSALEILSTAIKDEKIKVSEIATMQGRFYAMDRDKNLDRTKIAYDALVNAVADHVVTDPVAQIAAFYKDDINDEIIPPVVIDGYRGAERQDHFWMLNFRTDRIKQILKMLIESDFSLMSMTRCGDEIDCKSRILFPHIEVKNTLGEVLSQNGIRQLRIAETEKYAHVTYFFNGNTEVQYEFEDRILIPSPKVNNYASTPAMSSRQITDEVIKAMVNSAHQVIIVNFANADMLGHTGNFEATRKSIKILDANIHEIIEIAKATGYTVILTSDHGNAETMLNGDLSPQKSHTNAKVPFIIIPEQRLLKTIGNLSDIAPTVLSALEISVPLEMSGQSLI